MKLSAIKNGWAARGQGWAVHGRTREEAQTKFAQAEALHKVIDARTREQVSQNRQSDLPMKKPDSTVRHTNQPN